VAGRLLLPISVRPIRRRRPALLQLNSAASVGARRRPASARPSLSRITKAVTNPLGRARPCGRKR
jgi:hypothetical protein